MIQISGPPTNYTGAGNDLELVSLSLLKTYLDRTAQGSGDDTLLQTLLDNVHRATYQILGRRVLKSTGTAYVMLLSGRGETALYLPQWPIVSVTEILEGYVSQAPTTFVTSRTLTTNDYYLGAEIGAIWSRYTGWQLGRHNYKITWEAGFPTADMPQDIQDGICQWVGAKLQRIKEKRWDKLTVAKETESTAYTADEIPERALDFIRHYRRAAAGIG